VQAGYLVKAGAIGEVVQTVNIAPHKVNDISRPDQKAIRYIDCDNVELPFGPQFVSDVVNRTHTGQNQEQALLAAELVLKAQKNAKLLTFSA
jgi:hypothetical protein